MVPLSYDIYKPVRTGVRDVSSPTSGCWLAVADKRHRQFALSLA